MAALKGNKALLTILAFLLFLSILPFALAWDADTGNEPAEGVLATSADAVSPYGMPVFDFGALVRRVHFAFRAEGDGYEGEHDTYSVRVDANGEVTFVPILPPQDFIDEAPDDLMHDRLEPMRKYRHSPTSEDDFIKGAPVTFETVSIERGVVELSSNSVERIERDEEGGMAIERRGSVHIMERILNSEDGVELSWSFKDLPKGAGDLLVRVGLLGYECMGSTARGLHFADTETGLGVRVCHGVWTNATMRAIHVAAEWTHGEIVFRIPEEIVRESVFPMALDTSFGPEEGGESAMERGEPLPDSQWNPSVSFGDGLWLVVWEDKRFDWADIFGSRVDASMTVLDPLGIAISTAPEYEGYPSVSFGNGTWLVVWEDNKGGPSDDEIYGARVDGNGNVLDGPPGIPICTYAQKQENPSVSFGNDTWLVVWENNEAIWGARVDGNGTLLDGPPGIDICITSSKQLNPSVSFGSGAWLVVWEDDRGPYTDDIYCARVDSYGTLLDPYGILIETSTVTLGKPSVAFGGGLWLVVWEDWWDGIQGARIDMNGYLLDGPPGSHGYIDMTMDGLGGRWTPSVAFGAGLWLVVWEGGTYDGIYGTRVDGAGSILDPLPHINISSSSPEELSSAFGNGSWLVVWGYDSLRSDIYGRPINVDGTLGGPEFPIAIDCEDDQCAIDGRCYDDGEPNPDDPCLKCDFSQSQTYWSDNDGAPCDDGLWCNRDDWCAGGICSFHPYTACDPQCQTCNEYEDRCQDEAGPCEDGIFCTGEDWCVDGACTGHAGDPCDPVCEFPCDEQYDCYPKSGEQYPCEDGIWCNGNDWCVNGSCSGHSGDQCSECWACDEGYDICQPLGPVPCTDDLFCNGQDLCASDGCTTHFGNPCPIPDGLFCNGEETAECIEDTDECGHTGDPCEPGEICNEDTDSCDLICEGCEIGDVCFGHLTVNPANPCEICDIGQSTTAWSDNDGAPCPDGLYCNGTDTCLGGTCSAHSGDPCTDDGLWCNGAESCDEENDQCVHEMTPEERCLDDVLFCTGVESCDEFDDQCVSSGNPCLPTEICDEGEDDCIPCEYGCVIDEICWPRGTINPANPCEICHAASQTDWSSHSGGPCDDDDLWCTGTGICQGRECIDIVEPCPDDGQFCTGVESCDEGLDQCMSSGDPCPDDEVYCTLNFCYEEVGGHRCEYRPTDELCDNEQYCDGAEVCDPNLDCQPGTPPCPDDGLFCNGMEECIEELDQCLTTGNPCDDGLFCTGEEGCEEEAGGYQCTGTHTGDPCDPVTQWCSEASESCESWIFEEAGVWRYDGPANWTDVAEAIAVDSEGNVVVTGWSSGIGTEMDFATVKYTPEGTELWVAWYDGPANQYELALAIAVDSEGSVAVTGWSHGIGTGSDYATVKYDAGGAEQWVNRYDGPGNGSDSPVAVAVDGAGNVYVTGYSQSSVGDNDYATVKYDATDGTELWVARYDGPGHGSDRGAAIAVDEAGNVYVTGGSHGSGTEGDYATIKYHDNGATYTEEWVARYEEPVGDSARAIVVAPDGNVIVTGGSTWGNDSDYATVKYDTSDGTEMWVSRYDGPGYGSDSPAAVAVDEEGRVYVTGQSEGYGTGYDFATVKYDAEGNERWVARYDGPDNDADSAKSVAVDGTGAVYVAGHSYSDSTFHDYTTVKYDAKGNELWVKVYNGPGNSSDYAKGLVLDGFGNVVITGESEGSGTGTDYATVKYGPCMGCLIEDECYEDGALKPENVCQICDIVQSMSSWSDNDGALCDDDLFCTGEDTCEAGVCTGAGDPCIDGSDCTDDFCDEDLDECDNPCIATDPESPCCLEPACQEAPICRHEPGIVVVDELFYDADGSDEGWEYVILYNSTPDEIALTGWELQWGGTDFTYGNLDLTGLSVPALSALILGEALVPAVDVVVDFSPALQNGGSASDGVRVADAVGTVIDTVIYDSPNTNVLPGDGGHDPYPDGMCAPEAPEGMALSRDEAHTDTDDCLADFTIALAYWCPDGDSDGYYDEACGGDDCDDTDPAVNPGAAEVCDGVDNNCADGIDEEPAASASCDNDLWCDGEEFCYYGSCFEGTAPDCSDGVGCTDDSCNDYTDTCDRVPDDGLCDDGLWCNGAETCDEAADCQAGTAPDCADTVGCTVDSCNEETDTCDHAPDDGLCDDELWCNGAETCDELADCQAGTAPDCADTVGCTVDSCNEETDSCDHAPDDGLCDDELWCNGAETCDDLADCQAGTAPDCSDDGQFCTGVESCDEDLDQCVSSGDPCPDDGLWCNGIESCAEGLDLCMTTGNPCIDGSTCTDDICDEGVDECDNPCIATGPSDPCCTTEPACVDDQACEAEFTLDLDASYITGILVLNYTIGTPESVTWSNYLVLISPSVQVIPLFSAPLPVLQPPYEIPIAFPFPSLGWVGIYTGLFTPGGPQAVELVWVNTE